MTGSVVQIVGGPGMGKSSVAAAWATASPLEVHRLEGSAASQEDLSDGVAAALQLPVGATVDRLPTILARRNPVLWLDDAKRLSPATVEKLLSWREAAPGLSLLITVEHEAEALGGSVLEVGPLPLSALETMFREHAEPLHPAYQPDPAELSEALATLGGCPQLALLAAGMAPQVDWHQGGVVEAALQALSDEARSVLAAAMAFQGPFGRDALLAISPVEDTLDALEELLDAGMLELPSWRRHRRYRVPSLVRAAAPAPEPHTLERLAQHTVTHCRALADKLHTANGLAATTAFIRERTNLAAVKQQSIAHAPQAALLLAELALVTGPWHSATARALSGLSAGIEPEMEWRLRLTACDALHKLRDHSALAQQLDQLPELDEPPIELELRRRYHTALLLHSVDLGQAAAAHEDVHNDAYEHGLLEIASQTARTRASCALFDGHASEALSWFITARDLADTTPNMRLQAGCAADVAFAMYGLDQPASRAAVQFQLALDLFTQLGDIASVGVVALRMALLRMDQEELEQAESLSQLAVANLSAVGDVAHQVVASANLATLLMAQQRFEEAQAILSELAPVALQRNRQKVMVWFRQALLHHAQDRYEEAIELYERGLTESEDAGDAMPLATYGAAYVIALTRHRPSEAQAAYDKLVVSCTDHRHRLFFRIAASALEGTRAPHGLAREADRYLLSRLYVALVEQAIAGVVVARDGTWFEAAGGRVDLGRRRVLKRVLAALAVADRPLTRDDLLEAGWPNQRTTHESGTARVHVAISTLRKLGLKEALATRETEDGVAYCLVSALPAE